MNTFGRVAFCGSTSTYNKTTPAKCKEDYFQIHIFIATYYIQSTQLFLICKNNIVFHYDSFNQFYKIQISGDDLSWPLISKQIKIEGFIIMEQWQSEHAAAYKQIVQWIKEVRKSCMDIESIWFIYFLIYTSQI